MSVSDQTLKQDILVVQGIWNAKVREYAQEVLVDLSTIRTIVTRLKQAIINTAAERFGKQRW